MNCDTPNVNQCCLQHVFQLTVFRSHVNQKRVEISRGFSASCSTNSHTTALPETITMGKKKHISLTLFQALSVV